MYKPYCILILFDSYPHFSCGYIDFYASMCCLFVKSRMCLKVKYIQFCFLGVPFRSCWLFARQQCSKVRRLFAGNITRFAWAGFWNWIQSIFPIACWSFCHTFHIYSVVQSYFPSIGTKGSPSYINGHSRILNWRYLTYIRPIYGYVRNIPPKYGLIWYSTSI